MARKIKTVVAPIETTLEVVAEPVVDTATSELELVEPVSLLTEWTSLLRQHEVTSLENALVEDNPAAAQVEKNVGVGQFIRKLIGDGMANKDILKVVHEQYGNKNTTYACVAWYRNKMKKAAHAKTQSAAVAAVTAMLEEPVTETEEVKS